MPVLRTLIIVATVIAGFPLLFIILFLGFAWVDMRIDDTSYAKRVFRELQYERVLASGAGSTFFGASHQWDNCAYAVVSLPLNAESEAPAPSRLPGFRERHIYLDEWQPTPTSNLRVNGETLFTHWCEPNFRQPLFKQMLAAAETDGGWYNSTGRSLVVFSAPLVMAFMIDDVSD